MDVDRSELNNLAKKHPERVKAMHKNFMDYCKWGKVLPLGKKN